METVGLTVNMSPVGGNSDHFHKSWGPISKSGNANTVRNARLVAVMLQLEPIVVQAVLRLGGL